MAMAGSPPPSSPPAYACSRRTKKIFVEYHRLMTSKSGKKPPREFVDATLVRPAPPCGPPCSVRFAVDDDIDAFHNDGWWEGVVIEVLEGSIYSVFFRCSREQIEFDESEHRVHRQWVNGDWVPPLKPKSPLPSQSPSSQKPESGDVIEKISSNNSRKLRTVVKGETSSHLFGFIMCPGATAAMALKTVLQGILLTSEGCGWDPSLLPALFLLH